MFQLLLRRKVSRVLLDDMVLLGVGQATHGQHNRLRAPGSIGAASYPARVFKGMRMAGQMGNEKVKVQNLSVLKVNTQKNLLLLKGCVPGHKNSYVIIQK